MVTFGDDPRERRLAGAGRSPEDDRLQQVALDRVAQRRARAEQLLLADELVERARPHPLGERRAVPPLSLQTVGGSSKSDMGAVPVPLPRRLVDDQRRGNRDVQRFDRWLHRNREALVGGVDD